jgi:hypothetical protein
MKRHSIAAILVVGLAGVALGQTNYPETEPNETRAAANGPFTLSPGDTLSGESHGTSFPPFGFVANGSFDYFYLQPAATPPGIYRNTLTVAAPAACNIITIGFGQIDGAMNYRGAPLEGTGIITAAAAAGATPARTAVWYTFGPSSGINLRVQNATTASPNNYVATFGQTQETPTDLGSLPGGVMTITTVGQGHTSNTAMWVFDSSFHSIPNAGNDDVPDPAAHTVLQSTVTREYLTPGDYYLALTSSALMVDQECPDPPADRQPNSAVSDPGTVQCTSATVALNLGFAITDGAGVVHQYPATKNDGFQVLWFKFTVTAPATGSCCKPDGTCVVASQGGCTTLLAGTYGGDGSNCSSPSCTQPPLGACCQLDGTCVQTSQYACSSYSGAWHGAGSSCAANGCPGTVGRGDSGVYTPLSAGAQQGGLLIDVTAGSQPITVKRFDIYCVQAYNNAPSTAPMQFFIYQRSPMAGQPGTYVGFEGGASNPGGNGLPPNNGDGTPAWVLNTNASGLSTPGLWQTIPITLTTPVTIAANSTLGFYIASHGGGLGWFNGGDTTFTGTGGVTLTTSQGRTFAFQNAPGWGTNLAATQASFNGRIYFDRVTCGSADFNCDGDIGTDADIEAFFACIAGNCPQAPCFNGADFNYDGDIGTDADIEAFFRVLAGGTC